MVESLWNYTQNGSDNKYPVYISSLKELREIMRCLHLMKESLIDPILYYFSNQFIDHSIILKYINYKKLDLISIVRTYGNIIEEDILSSLRILHDHYLSINHHPDFYSTIYT